MYKILIADDEGIVRDSLRFIIEKNFGEECELLFAKNGRQAIEEVENSRPDILFLDIQMPGINGLRALEEIRAMNSRVRTVILTAYDNFEYAKTAIQLGASDYLTKPIQKQQITDRLNQLFSEIDRERKRRREALQIQEKMAAVVPIIENGFVLSLILQQDYRDSAEQYRQLLDIQEHYGMVFVLEWGENGGDGSVENPVGSGVRGHRHYEKMSEIVKIYYKAYISSTLGDKLVFILPVENETLSYTERVHLIEKARSMNESLTEEVNSDFRLGIGSVQKWDNIHESYQEALNALRHGVRSVTHIDDLVIRSGEEKHRRKLEQVLTRTVLSGIEHEAGREASVYLSWICNQEISLKEKKMFLLEFLLSLRKEMESQGGEQDISAELIGFLDSEDEEHLKELFVRSCISCAKKVLIASPQIGSAISAAADYIRKNFRKELTQEEVAAQIGISPYYFSKLFKEEMGVNYSEYLTELRIEQAKSMLENPTYSIKEICLESGYANPNYFSRIFKKVTGTTPTEYRDAVLGSSESDDI